MQQKNDKIRVEVHRNRLQKNEPQTEELQQVNLQRAKSVEVQFTQDSTLPLWLVLQGFYRQAETYSL